ncbi:hypothetical protein B0H19DRAFT_1055610 [Mycena capillaripes]|nr:hypothetical protein B0H19DRAFT_1055610 [Mycena capillaripes]
MTICIQEQRQLAFENRVHIPCARSDATQRDHRAGKRRDREAGSGGIWWRAGQHGSKGYYSCRWLAIKHGMRWRVAESEGGKRQKRCFKHDAQVRAAFDSGGKLGRDATGLTDAAPRAR